MTMRSMIPHHFIFLFKRLTDANSYCFLANIKMNYAKYFFIQI